MRGLVPARNTIRLAKLLVLLHMEAEVLLACSVNLYDFLQSRNANLQVTHWKSQGSVSTGGPESKESFFQPVLDALLNDGVPKDSLPTTRQLQDMTECFLGVKGQRSRNANNSDRPLVPNMLNLSKLELIYHGKGQPRVGMNASEFDETDNKPRRAWIASLIEETSAISNQRYFESQEDEIQVSLLPTSPLIATNPPSRVPGILRTYAMHTTTFSSKW